MGENREKRLREALQHRREIHAVLRAHGKDILCSRKFIKTKKHVQHGTMSVNGHCKNVATLSLYLNDKLHLNGNVRDIVRGALLHDYFLYDWHDREYMRGKKLHGYAHADTALKNATRDYELTERQKDIIRSHMWPLNLTKLPRCREAWIVTMADKYCSTMETLKIHNGTIKERITEFSGDYEDA